ncbi:MAG: type II secretion system F family protein [Solirubrobacterales bacterium]
MPAFDPMLIFTALMAIGTLAGVGALALTLVRRDKQDERLKAVTERRRQLAVATAEQMRAKSRQQPKKKKSGIEELVEKLKLVQADRTREIKRSMQMAGWRDPAAPAKFVAATFGLPVVFALISLLYTSGPLLENKPGFIKLLVVLGAAAFGFYLPRILLSNAVTKRRQAIQKAFPDALDLMVICVEAGLSAEAAFNRVTEEMITGAPEVAEEFGLVAAELAFLPERRLAYENLAERTGMPAMKSLSTTLLQSEKYGTPVALGLRVLAQENRETRMAAAEKKAAALPAQLTVPMIIFFLPALFAVITGPAGIRISNGGG